MSAVKNLKLIGLLFCLSYLKINLSLYNSLSFSRICAIIFYNNSAPTYNSISFLPMMKDIRNEETDMTVSYKKLWKLLIDKDMKKKDLEKAAGISNYVISKMNKGENITVDIVGKICSALNCTPNDIMEFSDDSI